MKRLLSFLAILLLLCCANAFAQKKDEPAKEMDSREFHEVYGDEFYRQLSYPPEALENKLTGTAHVSFEITDKGKITRIKVEHSTLPGVSWQLDMIDRQTLELTPYKIDGKPQRVKVDATIDYSRVAGDNAQNMTTSNTFQEPLFLNPETGDAVDMSHIHELLNSRFKPSQFKKQTVDNQRIDIRFNIPVKGKISDICVSSGMEMLDELIATILAQPTQWFAAYVNEETVAYTVMQTVWMTVGEKREEKEPFNNGFIYPKFADGDFNAWLSQRLVYPKDCLKSKIGGQVVVRFTVMSDGTIGDDITVLETPHPLLSNEVIRVVKESKWQPEIYNGNPRDTDFIFPVIFKLPEKPWKYFFYTPE